MTNLSERTHRPWWSFLGWLLVGALWMLVIAGIFSIGIFILPAAVLATLFMVRRRGGRQGMLGLVAVGGLPFFLLARLNRNGQGTVLRSTGGGGVTGFVRTNPWPWVTLGALFFVAGVGVFLVTTRRRPRDGVSSEVVDAETQRVR